MEAENLEAAYQITCVDNPDDHNITPFLYLLLYYIILYYIILYYIILYYIILYYIILYYIILYYRKYTFNK